MIHILTVLAEFIAIIWFIALGAVIFRAVYNACVALREAWDE